MSKKHQIIQSFLQNNFNEKTIKKFYQWFLHPKDKLEKEDILFEEWNSIRSEADFSTLDSYSRILSRLGVANRKKTRLSSSFSRIAATILIPILAVGITYWYTYSSNTQNLEFVEHFAPNSHIETVTLPDGSTVTMNYGSIIIYPQNFDGKNREVFLSGEAKFSVVSDKQKAFIVKTKDMDIQALGTIFNVSSYVDNSQIITTLIEGKVKVDMKDKSESFVLSPADQVIYDKKANKIIKQQANISLELAWEQGHLFFVDSPIEDILQEIQRKYDINIYLNSKNMKDEKLTVRFDDNESLVDILNTLELLINNFNYKIEETKIHIY